jgi:predicted nucleotidyltransferase
MATTILSGFQALKQNLEITGLQALTVSTRQKNVRDAVAAEMTVLSSFLTGSYVRHTLISPLAEADIDIFVVLSSNYYEQDGWARLLDKLKGVLQKQYPKTPAIGRDGQAVTIQFTDFTVDIVPAFKRSGGGYLIPDTIQKRWVPTDPTVHTQVMSDANAQSNQMLIPIVKMVKGWNRVIKYAFDGFYLELAARSIFANVPIRDFPSGVRFFFDKGRERVKYKIIDPAGYGDQINPLRNVTTVDDAVSRFQTAYNRSVKAEQFAADGKTEDAFEEWRKVFGSYFPTWV